MTGGPAFLLETAIEMYLEEGHPRERTAMLAKALLELAVEFELSADWQAIVRPRRIIKEKGQTDACYTAPV